MSRRLYAESYVGTVIKNLKILKAYRIYKGAGIGITYIDTLCLLCNEEFTLEFSHLGRRKFHGCETCRMDARHPVNVGHIYHNTGATIIRIETIYKIYVEYPCGCKRISTHDRFQNQRIHRCNVFKDIG